MKKKETRGVVRVERDGMKEKTNCEVFARKRASGKKRWAKRFRRELRNKKKEKK